MAIVSRKATVIACLALAVPLVAGYGGSGLSAASWGLGYLA